MSPRRTRRGTVRESVLEIDTSVKSASKTTKSTRRANKSQIVKTDEDSDSVVDVTASSFLNSTSSNVRSRKRRGQESLLSQGSPVPLSADESKSKSQKKNPPKSRKAKGAKPKNLDSSLISEDESFNAKTSKAGKRVSYSTDLISEDEEVPTAALRKRGKLDNKASSKVVPKTPEKSTPKKASLKAVESVSGRVTPESSPIIDIPLTPHRSTKTPKKSPVNLGSPKTHSRNSLNLLNVSRRLSITDSPPSSEASTPLHQSDTSGNLSRPTRNKKTSKNSVAKSKVSSVKKGAASPKRKVSISPKVILKPMKSKSRLSPKISPIKISTVLRRSSTSTPLKAEKLPSDSVSQIESPEIFANVAASRSKSNLSKSNEVIQTKSKRPAQKFTPTKSKKLPKDASPSKSPKSPKKSPATRSIKSPKDHSKTETTRDAVLPLNSPDNSSKLPQKSKNKSASKEHKSPKHEATLKNVGSPLKKTSPAKSSKRSDKNAVSSKSTKTPKSTSSFNKSAVAESPNVSQTPKSETPSKTAPSQSKKSPKVPSSDKSIEFPKVSSSSKSKKASKKTVAVKPKKATKMAFLPISKKMPKIVFRLKPNVPLKLSRTLSPNKSTKQVPKSSKSLSPSKPKKSLKKVDSLIKSSSASPKKTLSKAHSPKKSMSPRVVVNKLLSPRLNKSNISGKQNQLSIKLIPVDHAAQKIRSPRSSKSPKKSSLKPATPSAKLLTSMTQNAKRLSLNPAISTPSNVLAKKFQTLKPKNTSTPREKTKKPMTLSSKSSPPKQFFSTIAVGKSQNSKSVKSKIIKSLNNQAKIKTEPQLLEDESEPSMDSSSLIHMSDVFDSDLSTKNDTLKTSKNKRTSPPKAKSKNTPSPQKRSKHNTSETHQNSQRLSIRERSMNETYDIANIKSPELPGKSNKRTANEAKGASEKETRKNVKVHFANSSIGNQNQPSRISRVGTPGHAMQRKKLPLSESKKNDSLSNQSFNNKSTSRRSVSVSNVRTPTASSAHLRRSMSMSDSVSKPRRSTYVEQVASVNRLSRPKAIFTSEKKPTEKKETATRTPSASSAKKIPNFAEIHQKNFARMESLVDLKKRVEKRHVTLSAKKSGVPPSEDNNGYNRFGFKLRKTDAINIISKKSGGSVDSREAKRDKARTALKGVRMNRRFELQMKARLKTS